jgi:predicted RNase H-like HicB family nuclease
MGTVLRFQTRWADGRYLATLPGLPGWETFGETPREAVDNLAHLLELAAEDFKEPEAVAALQTLVAVWAAERKRRLRLVGA